MTSEKNLTKEFFRVFGIEPEINYVCDKRPCKKGLLKTCADIGYSHLYDTREDYPDITAEKLLKMICILNNYFKYNCWALTVTALRHAILENCIEVVVDKLLDDDVLEQFKHRIQQLFKD